MYIRMEVLSLATSRPLTSLLLSCLFFQANLAVIRLTIKSLNAHYSLAFCAGSPDKRVSSLETSSLNAARITVSKMWEDQILRASRHQQ